MNPWGDLKTCDPWKKIYSGTWKLAPGQAEASTFDWDFHPLQWQIKENNLQNFRI